MWRNGRGGYPKGKTTSNNFVGIVEVLGGDSALVRLNNGSTKVQTNTHTLHFGGKKGLVKSFHHLWRKSFAGIGD
jgi:hypothetical protein